MFSITIKAPIITVGKKILYMKMLWPLTECTKLSWKLSCLENSNIMTPVDLRLSNEKWVGDPEQFLLLGDIMLQTALKFSEKKKKTS